MAIQFDTLRYVEKMRSAGVSEEQAKAGAEALSAAFSEATSGVLATKDDIVSVKMEVVAVRTDLKVEIADVKSDLKIVKWAALLILAGVISLVLKSFGIFH
jgi:hypothetical protein